MTDLRKLLSLLAADPMAAADEMDKLASELKERAALIRQYHSENPNAWVVPGGMSDRVKMNVVGPDNKIKQSIDTGI